MVNTLNLLMGFLLDFFLGDPGGRWHPVVGIGKLIEGLEKVLFPRERHFRREFALGFVVVGIMVGGLGVTYFFLRRFLYSYSLVLFSVVEAYLIFNFLSLRTLLRRGEEVKQALEARDLPGARKNLKNLVGRDTDYLSEWEVVRGCVESLAENFNDGVIAPLFYISLFGALGGLIYKVTNTLDSMLGYKDFRYFFFGFASARLDDIFNFLPARLSILFIALAASILGRWGRSALFVAFRDARKHKSPNSGWPESAMAGALGVRLGGVNYYGGKREETAFLGDFVLDLTPERIGEALSIVRLSSFLALSFFVALSILMGRVW
ncbi:MAG TPA: adenosylcobinamide-phosphate synthase CbiB [Candidatus Atribacteria bacterium]|nr:adenosylcobinamide-phosphate synthase CbiB [Candidatus Atribacteria bacterium]